MFMFLVILKKNPHQNQNAQAPPHKMCWTCKKHPTAATFIQRAHHFWDWVSEPQLHQNEEDLPAEDLVFAPASASND